MISLIAGATVAGAYNWASSIYTYNRDAWMTDMQLDQARAYQLDNLRIAMKNMDREEIRDLMQSDIGRINNVIIVTTLILSLAGEMLFEAIIPDDCAAFVLNAYMLCLGSAMLHLVLSILFGMYASNEAYAISTQMLTTGIRPLWQAHFNKMKRRQDQEFTKAFDQKTMQTIFTPPMAKKLHMALSSSLTKVGVTKGEAAKGQEAGAVGHTKSPLPVTDPAVHGSGSHLLAGAELDANFKAELETDAEAWGRETSVGYRGAWQEISQDTWQHFKEYSFTCTAYGTKNLLEACGYLCIARMYGNNHDAWAFWAIQIIFVTLNVVMMQFLLGTGSLAKSLTVAAAPLTCAIAATTSVEWVDKICVPLCYLCHVMFTIFLVQNPTGGLEENGEDAEESSTSRQTSAEVTQETTYFFQGPGNCCDCSDAEQELTPNQLSRQTSPSAPPPPREFSLRKTSKQPAVPREHSLGLKTSMMPAADLSPATRSKKKVAVRLIPKLMLRRGLSVVGALWMSAFGWALYGSIWGMDFKNDMAMMPQFARAPEVADLTQVPVAFPSPYFKPHALVCPRGQIFLADSYRVFQLSDSSAVEPYPCDVNETIADLAAACDENACWPLVLLATDPPTVLDCNTGHKRMLLQTHHVINRFTAPVDESTGTLYAVRHGEVVQYQWQRHRSGWAPVWDIAKVDGELRAIDVVGNRLLLFSAAGEELVVEARNLQTGASCGMWTMPPELMGAGCGVHGKESILTLVRNKEPREGAVSIMEARLPGAAASCGLSDDDGKATVAQKGLRLSSLRGAGRNASHTMRSL